LQDAYNFKPGDTVAIFSPNQVTICTMIPHYL
jgi:hypothetical protein